MPRPHQNPSLHSPAVVPRRRIPLLFLAAVQLAFAMASHPAFSQIFKCVDGSGKATYQQTPCTDSTKSTTLPETKPSPATPSPKQQGSAAGPALAQAPERTNSRKMREISTLLAYWPVCSEMIQGFGPQTESGYRRWRQQNSAAIGEIESTPGWQAEKDRAIAKVRKAAATEGVRKDDRRFCDELVIDFESANPRSER